MLRRYHEYIQKEQIAGILDDRWDKQLSVHDMDEDGLEDIYDRDDLTIELWNKRAALDPTLLSRPALNTGDMRWVQEEADMRLEQLSVTELEKEKVPSYGI